MLKRTRLLLRPIADGDASWLLTHWGRPEVRRYLFDDVPVSAALVEEILGESEDDFARYGYGLWLLLEGDEPVGVCGLRATDDGQAELLYSVDSLHWGRGLATEAARAVLDHVGPILVVAETDAENAASERVAKALGMVLESERAGPNGILKRFVMSGRADSGA